MNFLASCARTIALLSALTAPSLLAAETVEVSIDGASDEGTISRHLYGHFAEHLGRCIYDGLWVGLDSDVPNQNGVRTDVIEALKEINVPNLRWPGGCFADDYHWRDGIGPPSDRPHTVNMHWGQVPESNTFGTHEFLTLCESLDAAPYIAGNVGSGTPAEMRDWIEYMTYDGDSTLANLRKANGRAEPWRVPFFGVGNENWGCGGNMTVEYYSDLYRRYATFCPSFSGNRLTKVACGPGSDDPHWIRVMMKQVGRRMQGLSLHKYTLAAPWSDKLSATGFGEGEWFSILREARLGTDKFLSEAEEVMDEFDPQKRIKIYLDEWGTWYRVEEGAPSYGLYQQNTLRDALVAGLSFHVFHEHNDRLAMANIAQTVNVLQALVLTQGDKMLLTPTYHVFDLYQVHQNAQLLKTKFKSPKYEFGDREMPAISLNASRNKEGKVHVSIVNVHPRDAFTLACELEGVEGTSVKGRILTADKLDEHNTFENPEQLVPQEFKGASIDGGKLSVELPAKCVVVLEID